MLLFLHLVKYDLPHTFLNAACIYSSFPFLCFDICMLKAESIFQNVNERSFKLISFINNDSEFICFSKKFINQKNFHFLFLKYQFQYKTKLINSFIYKIVRGRWIAIKIITKVKKKFLIFHFQNSIILNYFLINYKSSKS